MIGVNIMCHLPDLVDSGLDESLDLIQGRIGATGICVPLATGPHHRLRFGRNVSPRWFTSRGGIFFQPDRDRYAATRCSPLPSEWLRGRNPVSNLAQRCRERGLALRARLECTNFGRIVERYPFAARKNVFSDPSPAQVCLVNPDVVELIRATAEDLAANCGIETVELCGLDALWPPGPPADADIGLGARQLMALCFCESCRQSAAAAGIAAESAARSVQVRLERLFQTGRPIEAPLTQLAADDPVLSQFLAWYRTRIGDLFRAIKAKGPRRAVSHTRPLVSSDPLGSDGIYALAADAVVCEYADRDGDALRNLVRSARSLVGEGGSVEAQLELRRHLAFDPQSLVKNLVALSELGVPTVTLDGFGALHEDGVEFVKQAVRFAKRSTA